jgi:ADP-heptose:LPS heptosyltransferase
MPTPQPFPAPAQLATETQPRPKPAPVRTFPRLLLIRRRYLGDIVLLGSVVSNLRRHWPDAYIVVLTETGYAGVTPLHPDVDAALTFPRRAAEWPAFLRALRRQRFSHVLDFDNTEKTALVTRFTGAPIRATFDRELIVFRYRRLYTHAAKVTNAFYDSHHVTDTYLALPAAIGVPIVSREISLAPRAADLAAARKLVAGAGTKVLVHPGSRSPHRVWPVERFATVCDRLQDELGAQVFLTAGPHEQPLLDEIRRHAKTHLISLKSIASVGALAALVAQFDVFLCHDSGPMHVAAGVGTPVVALFSSQNATIWRPLGPRHTVLQTSLPCACIGAAAPTPCMPGDSYRSYCVRKLSTDEVFSAVARTLATGR